MRVGPCHDAILHAWDRECDTCHAIEGEIIPGRRSVAILEGTGPHSSLYRRTIASVSALTKLIDRVDLSHQSHHGTPADTQE